MAEELKACPCCHKEAVPYWKGAGCTNKACMLCGLHFGYVEWQNHRAQLPSQGGEAVAYAAFADNGNIRMWCRSAIGMCELIDEHGNKAEPLYTHPADPGAVAVPRDKLQGLLWYADQLLCEVNAGARYAGSTAADAEHSDADYLEISALLEVKP